MGWPVTLAIAFGALIGGLFCGWRGALPPNLQRGPRLVPWRFLMLLCGTAVALMLVHAAALLNGG